MTVLRMPEVESSPLKHAVMQCIHTPNILSQAFSFYHYQGYNSIDWFHKASI